MRFDGQGEVRWQQTYPGPAEERLWSLAVAGDEVWAVGEAKVADTDRSQILVLHTTLDGRELGRSTLGEAPVEWAFAIRALAGGDYVIAGMSGSGPRESAGYDAKIGRYGCDGSARWVRAWGGAGFDVAHDLDVLGDGDLAVAGYTTIPTRGADVFLLRLLEIRLRPGESSAPRPSNLPRGTARLRGESPQPGYRR